MKGFEFPEVVEDHLARKKREAYKQNSQAESSESRKKQQPISPWEEREAKRRLVEEEGMDPEKMAEVVRKKGVKYYVDYFYYKDKNKALEDKQKDQNEEEKSEF